MVSSIASPIVLSIALAAIALFAFATEAAIGFGATVLTVTLGAQLVPLDQLLPAFVPVNFFLSSVVLARNVRHVAWPLLLRQLAPATLVGLGLGLLLFRLQSAVELQLAFAVFVVGLALIELRRRDTPILPLGKIPRSGLLLVGGAVHGLFGAGGPMIVYVLGRLTDDKAVFRATLAVTWLSLNTALLLNYASLHLLNQASARLSLVFLPSALLALVVGEWLHRRLDARRFRVGIYVLLLVAGSALAIRTTLTLLRTRS